MAHLPAPRPGETIFDLSISLSGEQDIARRFIALSDRARDLTPAWPEVDKVFHTLVEQQFRSEGGQSGREWEPLKPATQEAREREGYGPAHPILQRTGALRRSLTSITSDSVSVHLPHEYRRGTGVEYYGFHQSLEPRRTMPRRPMVAFSAADKDDIMRPIRVYLRGGSPDFGIRQRSVMQRRFVLGTGGR